MAYLGEDIKKLGFGLMRLPQKDGAIDIDETKKMVDMFLEAGFTRTLSGKRWLSVTRVTSFSWQPKTPRGLTAKRAKKQSASLKPA